MSLNRTFKLHPDAKIADPDAPGVKTLVECLLSQKSIRIIQSSIDPVQKADHGAQWLDCQTSGSTGQPKTIRRAPESWRASFELARSLFGVSAGDHYAVLGSIGSSLSLFAVLEALHLGATVSILAGRSPRDQLRKITARSVSVIYATPTQLRQLANAALKEGSAPVLDVRRILVGGGKCLASDREKLARWFPRSEVIEFYGSSETSFVSIAKGEVPHGSVGRVYPSVELKIDKRDGQSPYGEICVRSPYLAQIYVQPDKALARPDGFVSTGEIGWLDADGFLYLGGRVDRMVTVSDVNVFPEAIEETVLAMESVESCAVIPVPDPMRGHRLVLFVQPATQDFEPSAVRHRCRSVLGNGHVPGEVRIVSAIPVLATGKPDIQTLKEMVSG